MEQDAQPANTLPPEVLARRVCHDVAGLLGALDGLISLAHADADAQALARETTRALAARLRLIRGAWGESEEDLAGETVVLLARGLPGAERLQIVSDGLAPRLGPAASRLCLSLLMVAAEALPRGGVIRLSGDDSVLRASVEGRQVAWRTGDASPRGAAPLMLARAVAQAGWRMAADGAGLTLTAPEAGAPITAPGAGREAQLAEGAV